MLLKDVFDDNKKFLLLAFALLIVSLVIVYSLNSGLYSPINPIPTKKSSYTEPREFLVEGVDYMITVKTVYGDIDIDLYEQTAPRNVNSFLFLISERYYEGLTFHKVIKDFVLQAGDHKGDGTGDPGYIILKENLNAEFKDYSVGMANASQFFIVLPNSDKQLFNGEFTLIGEVISGFAVADSIAKVETDRDYKPFNDVVINSIQITE